MPKQTAKYRGACDVARRHNIALNGNQPDLYERHDIQDADEPTPLIMVRVWANAEIAEEAADDIINQAKDWVLVERSKAYPCRPPKQREARIYLRFLPKGGA